MPRIEKGDFCKLRNEWKRFSSGVQSPSQAESCCSTPDIICPDNDVTEDLDKARMEWSANDVGQNRPALSRWSKEYKDEFAQFVKDRTGK